MVLCMVFAWCFHCLASGVGFFYHGVIYVCCLALHYFVYAVGFFCCGFVYGVGIVLSLVATNSYYLWEANSKDAIISDAFCLPEITEKK